MLRRRGVLLNLVLLASLAGAAPAGSEAPDGSEMSGKCLCVFDVDRTLTGKQGRIAQCPADHVHPAIWDTAYGGGQLMLSDLGTHLHQTFCNECCAPRPRPHAARLSPAPQCARLSRCVCRHVRS